MTIPKWEKFEAYIVDRLKCIDPHCKRSPGSGNGNIKGDIYTQCGLHIECKDTDKKSVTFKKEVWEKLCGEIPLHSDRIPLYALEDKDYNKWVVLNLDDFLDIYIEWYEFSYGEYNGDR